MSKKSGFSQPLTFSGLLWTGRRRRGRSISVDGEHWTLSGFCLQTGAETALLRARRLRGSHWELLFLKHRRNINVHRAPKALAIRSSSRSEGNTLSKSLSIAEGVWRMWPFTSNRPIFRLPNRASISRRPKVGGSLDSSRRAEHGGTLGSSKIPPKDSSWDLLVAVVYSVVETALKRPEKFPAFSVQRAETRQNLKRRKPRRRRTV